jgi:outer membrane lipoprotein SlyB
MKQALFKHVLRGLAAAGAGGLATTAALALEAPAAASAASAAPAATAVPAAMQPSAKQLKALCTECAIVTAQAVEKRKGKAHGVGAAAGAVAGGVVGNQVGDSTAATVGGAVVGGVLGHAIEKRVKRHQVWITTVMLPDGSTRRFEALSDPQVKPGEVLKIEGGQLRKR